jgi:hypothetical protein
MPVGSIQLNTHITVLCVGAHALPKIIQQRIRRAGDAPPDFYIRRRLGRCRASNKQFSARVPKGLCDVTRTTDPADAPHAAYTNFETEASTPGCMRPACPTRRRRSLHVAHDAPIQGFTIPGAHGRDLHPRSPQQHTRAKNKIFRQSNIQILARDV